MNSMRDNRICLHHFSNLPVLITMTDVCVDVSQCNNVFLLRILIFFLLKFDSPIDYCKYQFDVEFFNKTTVITEN